MTIRAPHWRFTVDDYHRMAKAGIPEAWLVNLTRRSIEVHREPRDGRNHHVTVFRRAETITLLA